MGYGDGVIIGDYLVSREDIIIIFWFISREIWYGYK